MTTDPEIPALVEKVQTFQKQEKDEKQLSFYAALSLNAGYFWNFIEDDPLLKARTISDIAFFTLRLLLEDQEVLFPCAKSLMKTVERLEHKPQGVLDCCREFLENPCEQTREAFTRRCWSLSPSVHRRTETKVLTRFVEDNEQWWYKTRPLIAEW